MTEYCPNSGGEPPPEIIGGTQAVDVERIIALEPELVIANLEENDRQDVEAMEEAGLKVWVTFPRSVESAVQILWTIASLFRVSSVVGPKILLIERSLEWVQAGTADLVPMKVFVPIWQEDDREYGTYWMTFNQDTYCDSVLNTCGGANIFRERLRRYPLEAEFQPEIEEDPGQRDTRYPRVSVEEVVNLAPELIMLPSEPYNFNDQTKDLIKDLLKDTPAVQDNKVIPFDGRWLSWHGTMLAKALAELPVLLG
jgi:ABC-type Fe3+-hydroxamate transport system substrate-binding protein